jgi:signal transduction histidine kinase
MELRDSGKRTLSGWLSFLSPRESGNGRQAVLRLLAKIVLLFVLVGALLLAWDRLDHTYFDHLDESSQHLLHMIRGISTGVLVSVAIAWVLVLEQRRHENRLLALQKELIEKERLAAVGEVASGVAHEIRNPLMGISGSLSVIQRDLRQRDPRKEIMEEIQRQLNRISRMVDDLLSYSRPFEPRPRWIHPHTLLQQALQTVQNLPSLPDARVILELDPAVPEIYADFSALEQIFGNLILNAFQAVSAEGTVVVRTSRFPKEVGVWVCDDGCGIATEDQERIFEPFFTTRARGTGLGLSLVRRAVANHGGWIRVDSAPDKGATFELRLPIEGTLRPRADRTSSSCSAAHHGRC